MALLDQLGLPSGSVQLPGFTVSTAALFWIGVLLLSGFIANRISNVLIRRAVDRRGGDVHAAKSAQRVSAYVIYGLVFIASLGALGVPLSALGAAVGLIGLGLSFALKDMIANFISGIMILLYRPYRIGDQIRVAGEEGTVQDIAVRATAIRTYDGRKVMVPNSMLYNDVVVNNTAYDQRRFDVVVGVSYDDDVETAREIAAEVLEEAESVETDPEPQVLVDELGGSSVNLKLRGWTKPSRASLVAASSEVTQLVKQRFDSEGIDIPYPIRTVYLNE